MPPGTIPQWGGSPWPGPGKDWPACGWRDRNTSAAVWWNGLSREGTSQSWARPGPPAPVGGEFRQAVWKLLLDIPYGRTETYGELARRLAALRGLASMSAQAVGGAVGHNPISIVIPCHRVVGSGGSLTGYAGGVDKKRWLLSHEGVDVSGLTAPRRDT